MKLLIVDDESRIIAALRRSLRREGYEILAAESGEEALALLGDGPVDIILSDYKMPGMSGMDFLAAAAEKCPEAARLLITGWTEEVPKDRLASVGVDALIPKPWDDAELKILLREAAKSRAS